MCLERFKTSILFLLSMFCISLFCISCRTNDARSNLFEIAIGHSRGGLSRTVDDNNNELTNDSKFAFAEVSQPYADIIIDQRTLEVVPNGEKSEIKFDLYINDPVMNLAENPQTLKPIVYVNRTNITQSLDFTYELDNDEVDELKKGTYKTSITIPAQFGDNLIQIKSVNHAGFTSRFMTTIKLDDKDKLRTTQDDLFLSDGGDDMLVNNRVKAIDYQILKSKNIFGEFGRSTVNIQGSKGGAIKLRKESRFGRFETPFMVLDNHPVEGAILPTVNDILIGNPGDTITCNAGYAYKLYIEGISVMQKATESATDLKPTHTLLQSFKDVNLKTFQAKVFQKLEKSDITSFNVKIIDYNGHAVDLAGSASITVNANTSNAVFDAKGESFISDVMQIVDSLPNNARYDANGHKFALKPGDTVIASAAGYESRAIFLKSIEPDANNYEAITGVSPVVSKKIPVQGMEAVAQVLVHNRQLKLSVGLFGYPTRRLPFGGAVTYRSSNVNGDLLGGGWNASFEQYFYKNQSKNTNGMLQLDSYVFHGGDGREDLFAIDGHKLTAPDGFSVDTYLSKDGSKIVSFDVEGTKTTYEVMFNSVKLNITEIEDLYGNKIKYNYDESGNLTTIIDDADRKYNINIQNGRVSSIIDFAGVKYSFSYDGAKLESITKAGSDKSSQIIFSYDSNNMLNGIKSSAMTNNFISIAYEDVQGVPRITSVTTGLDTAENDPYIETFSFQSDHTRRIVNPTGAIYKYYSLPRYDGGSIISFDNMINYIVDPLGKETMFVPNKQIAKNIAITHPEGHSTMFAYDITSSYPTKRGQLISKKLVSADSGDADIMRKNVTDYEDKTFSDPILHKELGLDSAITRLRWSARKVTEDSSGRETTYLFTNDDKGSIKKITPPYITLKDAVGDDYTVEMWQSFEYNDFGQLTYQTDALGNYSWNEYFDSSQAYFDNADHEGLLKRTVSVAKRNGTYDENIPTNPRSNDNLVVSDFAYDAYCNTGTITGPANRSTISQYNCLAQQVKTISPPVSGDYRTTVSYLYGDFGPIKVTTKYPLPQDNAGNTYAYNSGVVDIAYSSLGKPSTVDDNGAVTTHAYNDVGWRTGESSPVGDNISFEYYTDGRMKSKTVDGRETITYKYNQDGGVGKHHSIEQGDMTVDLKLDGYRRVERQYRELAGAAITNHYGSTNYEYDTSGKFTRVGMDGAVGLPDYSLERDEYGQVKKTTQYVYVPGDNGILAAQNVEYKVYDNPLTGIREELNPRDESIRTKIHKDLLGRTFKVENTDGTSTETEYNKDGTVESVTVKDSGTVSKTTAYEYNNVGFLRKITFPDTSTVKYAVDGLGKNIFAEDADNSVAYTQYNLRGEIIQTIVGQGTSDAVTTTFTYYDDGRPHTITKGGITVTYVYSTDANGSKTIITYADGTNTENKEFHYNKYGKITKHIRRDTSEFNYVYDGTNQSGFLKQIKDKTGIVLRKFEQYDPLGRPAIIKEHTDIGIVQTNLSHDSFGIFAEAQVIPGATTKTVRRRADKHSLLQHTSYPSSIVNKFTYDNKNRVDSAKTFYPSDVWNPTGTTIHSTSFNYDTFGRGDSRNIVDATTQDCLSTTFGYDDDNISRIGNVFFTCQQGGDTAGKIVNAYKDNGLTNWSAYHFKRTDATPTEYRHGQTFAYYGDNRLKSVDYTDDSSFTSTDDLFKLDDLGNFQNDSALTGKVSDFGYTGFKRLTSVDFNKDATNDFTLSYGANSATGNVIALNNFNGSKWEYIWDAFNRVKQVTEKDQSDVVQKVIKYTYDSLNRRVLKRIYATDGTTLLDTWRYIYNGADIIQEIQIADYEGTPTESLRREYIYDGMGTPSIMYDRENSKEYFFARDDRGTVRAVTAFDTADSRYEVVERYEYSHLGERLILDPADNSTRSVSILNNAFAKNDMFFDSDINAYITVSGNIYRPKIGKSMSAGLDAPETFTIDAFANIAVSMDDILELNAIYSTPIFSEMGWTDTYLGWVPPRGWGALTAFGGTLEAVGGGVMFGVGFGSSWTGFGALLMPAGGVVFLHGLDTAGAGLRQTWTERHTKTLTSSGVSAGLENWGGLDRRSAEQWGDITDTAVGFIDIAAGATTVLAKLKYVKNLKSIKKIRALNRLRKWKKSGTFLGKAPKGTDFEGVLWRYDKPNRLSTTWEAGEYNIKDGHRYTREGIGGTYGSLTKATAGKEVSAWVGDTAGRVATQRKLKLTNLLDLRHPGTLKKLGVSKLDITGNSYIHTQAIGDWALRQGYNGIIAPSARFSGHAKRANIVIFGGL